MKQTLLRATWIMIFLSATLAGWSQLIFIPREPSPAAGVSQTVGISIISVKYSRPSIRGRAVWGTLVPYGWNTQGFGAGNSAPWRAGANENTVLHLSDAATIEGTPVPAGDYGLFFVINKDNSGEVILSKEYKSWGSFFYDQTQDQLRAKIKIRDMNEYTERLNYSFDSVSKNMAELDLNWEKKQFPVKIEFAVAQIVMENATEILKGPTAFQYQNLNAAAAYAINNNMDTAQTMKWLNRSLAANNKNYETMRMKAVLLRRAGDSTSARILMKDAMQFASENDLNTYGYQLLGEKKFGEAIDVLKLNTARHAESANAWDSLGEGYALNGNKKSAITSFRKSLSLKPTPATKENSEKYLKQLGAL